MKSTFKVAAVLTLAGLTLVTLVACGTDAAATEKQSSSTPAAEPTSTQSVPESTSTQSSESARPSRHPTRPQPPSPRLT